jgi:hypothetical protein
MMSRITQWILADAGLNDAGSLRYLLGRSGHTSRRSLLVHLLLAVAYVGMLIIGAVALNVAEGAPSGIAYTALYVPTVLAQALVSAAAFGLTIHTVHNLRRKQTWDSLRATAGGADAAMRAAWAAAVYYRLRGALGVLVYAPRLVLLGLLLWDLTAFRGDYLTLIAGGHQPAITPPFEILLLGAFVSAAFLLPLSAIGFEAAIGLLLSTFARSRQTASLIQIVLTIGRFIWGIAPMLMAVELISTASSGIEMDPAGSWFKLLLNGAAGDWGIGALHTATTDTIWSAIPYAAYIGVALLGVVLLHSGLTVLILRWASHRAQIID